MAETSGTTNIFPFGVIYQDRFEVAKKYKLIEDVSSIGIWKLTKKCKDNYDEVSFYHYLRGDVDTARRRDRRKDREEEIQALLAL